MILQILPEEMKEHQAGTRHASLRKLTEVGGVCCMDIGFVTNDYRGRGYEREESQPSPYTLTVIIQA